MIGAAGAMVMAVVAMAEAGAVALQTDAAVGLEADSTAEDVAAAPAGQMVAAGSDEGGDTADRPVTSQAVAAALQRRA